MANTATTPRTESVDSSALVERWTRLLADRHGCVDRITEVRIAVHAVLASRPNLTENDLPEALNAARAAVLRAVGTPMRTVAAELAAASAASRILRAYSEATGPQATAANIAPAPVVVAA